MDHINENNNIEDVVNHENPKLEQKNRSNRHHHNGNDLWIHVDAQGADNNKQMTLIAGFSAFAAISLAIVSLFQYEQTSKLVEQNEALKKQYEQTVALMQETNKEAIKELEIGLSSISNSIDKLTIAMQNGTPVVESTPQEQPAEVVVPVDNAAFFGVSIRTDGTEVTPLGLLIDSVYANSPAFTAGLRGGDILMTIDDITIDSFDAMATIIDSKKPGDTITVRYASVQNNTVYFNTVDVVLDSRSNFDTTTTETTPQP